MLKTVEKVLLLQDIDLFGLAATEHLARLALVTTAVEVPAGTAIFARGQTASELHIVVDGQVVLDDGNGNIQNVTQCGLDYLAVFSEASHVVNARTLDTCTILSIAFDDLADLLTDEAEFCWAILRFLGRFGLNRFSLGCDEPAGFASQSL